MVHNRAWINYSRHSFKLYINKKIMIKKILLTVLLINISQLCKSKNFEDFELDIEIPKQNVTEYHAPYIATWIETSDRKSRVSTSLWYDDQEKWLKDIRQWWRKTGRNQSKPYDGVTGATRRPGTHKLVLKSKEIAGILTPGQYVLFIEASREVGGREVLKIPFTWPITAEFSKSVIGEKELRKVKLIIK